MNYTKHTLQKIEDLFKELDYAVRYEKGSFHSGYCLVEAEDRQGRRRKHREACVQRTLLRSTTAYVAIRGMVNSVASPETTRSSNARRPAPATWTSPSP